MRPSTHFTPLEGLRWSFLEAKASSQKGPFIESAAFVHNLLVNSWIVGKGEDKDLHLLGFVVVENITKFAALALSGLFEIATFGSVFYPASFNDGATLVEQIDATYKAGRKAGSYGVMGHLMGSAAVLCRIFASTISLPLSIIHLTLDGSLFIASKVTSFALGSIFYLLFSPCKSAQKGHFKTPLDQMIEERFVPSHLFNQIQAQLAAKDPQRLAELAEATENLEGNVWALLDDQRNSPQNRTQNLQTVLSNFSSTNPLFPTFGIEAGQTILRTGKHLLPAMNANPDLRIALHRFVSLCKENPVSVTPFRAENQDDPRYLYYIDIWIGIGRFPQHTL